MKFYMPDHDENADDARCAVDYSFRHRKEKPVDWCSSPETYARLAADHVWSREDGWEMSWPQLLAIIDDDGKEHRFFVDMDLVPSFSARRADLRDQTP